MLFGLPARKLLRIDEKTTLPRLNEYLHWLRILQFMVSVAFMGIFINFVVGLPHGFEITHRMTAVYALVRYNNTKRMSCRLTLAGYCRCGISYLYLAPALVLSPTFKSIVSPNIARDRLFSCIIPFDCPCSHTWKCWAAFKLQ
jgi:hypothetical protein